MKTNLKTSIDGIESVNDALCDEMFVNELENRLETDPLLTNGLLNLVATQDADADADLLCFMCNSASNCQHNG